MHSGPSKFLLLLLVLAQGLLGVLRGQELCICLSTCPCHEEQVAEDGDAHHGCDHLHREGAHGCSGDPQRVSDPATGHDQDACCCHVHVPVPRQPIMTVASGRLGEDPSGPLLDRDGFAVTVAVADWRPAGLSSPNGPRERPPGPHARAQRRVIESTRLMI